MIDETTGWTIFGIVAVIGLVLLIYLGIDLRTHRLDLLAEVIKSGVDPLKAGVAFETLR